MNIIISVVSLFLTTAVIMAVGLTDIVTGWLKAVIVIPAVFVSIYAMARIPSAEEKAEKKALAKEKTEAALLNRQGTRA